MQFQIFVSFALISLRLGFWNCRYTDRTFLRKPNLDQIMFALVRDSSAVRRLFVRLAGAVGRQSALHKENSGFVSPTLVWHISTFRSYQILFSIRNPYINRFTNHFSIHLQPSCPQKVVLHSITAQFCLRPYHFAHLSRDFEKTTITAMYHGRWFAYNLTLSKMRGGGGEKVTHALSEAHG